MYQTFFHSVWIFSHKSSKGLLRSTAFIFKRRCIRVSFPRLHKRDNIFNWFWKEKQRSVWHEEKQRPSIQHLNISNNKVEFIGETWRSLWLCRDTYLSLALLKFFSWLVRLCRFFITIKTQFDPQSNARHWTHWWKQHIFVQFKPHFFSFYSLSLLTSLASVSLSHTCAEDKLSFHEKLTVWWTYDKYTWIYTALSSTV